MMTINEQAIHNVKKNRWQNMDFMSHIKAWNVHIINIPIACETELNSRKTTKTSRKHKYKTKYIHSFFGGFKAFMKSRAIFYVG